MKTFSNECDLSYYFSYYDMPVEEVRKLINAIDDKKTYFNSPPFISEKLRKLVGIPKPIELKQKIEKIEKQMQDMNESLSRFIKNSNMNNGIKEKIDVNDNNDMDMHSNKKT